jgi:hypothetical protein
VRPTLPSYCFPDAGGGLRAVDAAASPHPAGNIRPCRRPCFFLLLFGLFGFSCNFGYNIFFAYSFANDIYKCFSFLCELIDFFGYSIIFFFINSMNIRSFSLCLFHYVINLFIFLL